MSGATETARSAAAEATRDIAADRPLTGGACSSEPTTPLRTAGGVLLVALWSGLLGGGLEGAWWAVRQGLGGDMVFLHPGYFWMAPLVLTAAALLVGCGLAGLAWRVAARDLLPFAVTCLSLLAWLNILQAVLPGLHFWSWTLLGCGLAATTGRIFQAAPTRALRCMAWSSAALVLVFLASGGVQTRLRWSNEQEALAAVPSAAAAEETPNVLLIVLDTVRGDMVAAPAGSPAFSPQVSRFAQRGVVFRQAVSTAPWTLPAQAGMFTGRLPHEVSADWLSRLSDEHRTLAEELASRGWVTGGFVANTRYCSEETGLARGFTHYEAYRFSWADMVLTTALGRKALFSQWAVQLGMFDWPARKRATEINERFLGWLDKRRAQGDQRPYFAFLNYWDAHDPYFPSTPASSLTTSQKLLLRNWWWVHKEGLSEDQATMLREAYGECVRQQDLRLGRLFAELERRGDLEDTLVIITADHGEHFGEHDLYLHGNSLYQPLIHVPLAVVWPGRVPSAREVRSPVSLRGLPNTVLQLLGCRETVFPGRSWVDWWSAAGEPPPQPAYSEIASQAACPPCHGRSPVAAGPMRCVRLGDWKLIRNGDGTEELYDLASDPWETRNLSAAADAAERLGELRRLLERGEEAVD